MIWAEEFDISSLPACQDTAIEYRIELLDGEGDDLPAGDADSLLVGCDHLGTNMIRLWVRSLPSGATDHCDVVLVVQSDFTGCVGEEGEERREVQVINIEDQATKRPVHSHLDGERIILQGLGDQPSQQNWAVEGFRLEQNFPNPYKDQTSIGFVLPQASNIILTIFSLDGKPLKSYQGQYQRGYYQIELNTVDLPYPAVLYYHLQAGDFMATRKMLRLP